MIHDTTDNTVNIGVAVLQNDLKFLIISFMRDLCLWICFVQVSYNASKYTFT